jgi:hypothetical protein
VGAKLVKLRARWVIKTGGRYFKPGETFELDADEAKRVVDQGAAEYVKELQPSKGKAATKAPAP